MSEFEFQLAERTQRREHLGCDAEEVDELEKALGITLPISYRRFLVTCGRGLGGFLVGTDYQFDDLGWMNAAAHELVHDGGAPPLPDGSFVFAMHQGYQFFFFLGNRVYFYREGKKQFDDAFATFEDFFLRLGDS